MKKFTISAITGATSFALALPLAAPLPALSAGTTTASAPMRPCSAGADALADLFLSGLDLRRRAEKREAAQRAAEAISH